MSTLYVLLQHLVQVSFPSNAHCADNSPFSKQLWTDEKSRNFIAKEYPWFLETFDSYKYPIQRADSIRYFVLAYYGGTYIDLDDVRIYILPPPSLVLTLGILTVHRAAIVAWTLSLRIPLGCDGPTQRASRMTRWALFPSTPSSFALSRRCSLTTASGYFPTSRSCTLPVPCSYPLSGSSTWRSSGMTWDVSEFSCWENTTDIPGASSPTTSATAGTGRMPG